METKITQRANQGNNFQKIVPEFRCQCGITAHFIHNVLERIRAPYAPQLEQITLTYSSVCILTSKKKVLRASDFFCSRL